MTDSSRACLHDTDTIIVACRIMPRLRPFCGTASQVAGVIYSGRAATIVRQFTSLSSSSSSESDGENGATTATSKPARRKSTDSTASGSSSSSSSSSSSPLSTVERGTIFENHTLAFLQQTFPRMTLMRSGGANDGGIDLTGWWWYPLRDEADASNDADKDELKRIRVTVQCKAEAKKLSPVHVRELHGIMSGRFTADRDDDATNTAGGGGEHALTATPIPSVTVPSMAVLSSSAGFSTKSVQQAMAAPFPLLLLHLLHPMHDRFSPPAPPPHPFVCHSIIANDALRDKLLRGHMEVRWLATLVQPPRTSPRGRPPSPVRTDMPYVFLRGKQR